MHMVQRQYWMAQLDSAWRDRSVVWLMGVRRVGKTVLAQSVPDAEYLDCELPSTRRQLDDVEAFLSKRSCRTVVLDEIHRLPDASQFAEDALVPGTIGSSSMRRAGLYLTEVFKLNHETKNFRFLSPDETYSNKLDQIFTETSRAWQWPIKPWDKDLSPDGRVM
jgi:phosphoketolase